MLNKAEPVLLSLPGWTEEVRSPLLGEHNLRNLIGAAGKIARGRYFQARGPKTAVPTRTQVAPKAAAIS